MVFGLFQFNVKALHVPSNEIGGLTLASTFIGALLLGCFVNDLAPPAMTTSYTVATSPRTLSVDYIHPAFVLSSCCDPRLGSDGDYAN